MIVCSCNVLTDHQILATLRTQDGMPPRSPGEAYRCLGCAPRCGRCLSTVRKLLAESQMSHCRVGCAECPGTDSHHASRTAANDDASREVEVEVDADVRWRSRASRLEA